MDIGIFAKTFARPSLAATLDAVLASGLRVVQLNMACAGLPSMPDTIPPALAASIRRELAARDMRMAAVSGTFNVIHPGHEARAAGMRCLRVLAAACHAMGTSTITLSTGTRDAQDMWRAHPENASQAAWDELLVSMRQIAAIGAEFGVTMAFEPEVSNVVDSAGKARRLLDELDAPHVKVVMDGANLFHAGELPAMTDILDEAFALLGSDIALAHAKDLSHDGAAGHEAAGQGVLDYPRYLRLLQGSGYAGPLILHGLSEAQVNGCVRFLQAQLAQLGAAVGSLIRPGHRSID
jgi:sugar phosphate isomerase/epimerase